MSAAVGRHSKRDVLLFGRWQGPLRHRKNVLLNSARPEWKSVGKRERWMLSWVFARFCDESVADVDAQTVFETEITIMTAALFLMLWF